ncbi:hypothetical protein ACFSTD_10325 [Novosphingobium colocasiae]
MCARFPIQHGKTYREFISRTNPDTHGLSEADRDLLKGYAEVICERFTAAAISDASHDQVWEAADEGEEIPLYAIFASQAGAITDDVRAWANEVVGKLAA